MRDISLYDSDTDLSLETTKEVDSTEHQTRGKEAFLLFTHAKRGRIVQLQSDGMRIHYFFDEEGGRKMIIEDCKRFGFIPFKLLELAIEHAPEKTA